MPFLYAVFSKSFFSAMFYSLAILTYFWRRCSFFRLPLTLFPHLLIADSNWLARTQQKLSFDYVLISQLEISRDEFLCIALLLLRLQFFFFFFDCDLLHFTFLRFFCSRFAFLSCFQTSFTCLFIYKLFFLSFDAFLFLTKWVCLIWRTFCYFSFFLLILASFFRY